jgi:hypothetical protein
LAQEFDTQLTELDADLAASDKHRKRLFADLKGDAEARLPGFEKQVPEDLGDYQTANRVLSWLRLAAADEKAGSVLITTSRSVFDYFIEFIPRAVELQTIAPLPADEAFCAELRRYWTDMAKSGQPGAVGPPVASTDSAPDAGIRLTVAVLPAETLEDVVGQLISDNFSVPENLVPGGHIVLNLLEV